MSSDLFSTEIIAIIAEVFRFSSCRLSLSPITCLLPNPTNTVVPTPTRGRVTRVLFPPQLFLLFPLPKANSVLATTATVAWHHTPVSPASSFARFATKCSLSSGSAPQTRVNPKCTATLWVVPKTLLRFTRFIAPRLRSFFFSSSFFFSIENKECATNTNESEHKNSLVMEVADEPIFTAPIAVRKQIEHASNLKVRSWATKMGISLDWVKERSMFNSIQMHYQRKAASNGLYVASAPVTVEDAEWLLAHGLDADILSPIIANKTKTEFARLVLIYGETVQVLLFFYFVKSKQLTKALFRKCVIIKTTLMSSTWHAASATANNSFCNRCWKHASEQKDTTVEAT